MRGVLITATVLAAAVCAATAFGATPKTADGTFLCSAPDQGGVNVFHVDTSVDRAFGSIGASIPSVEILEPRKLNQYVGAHATNQDFLDGRLHYEKAYCATVSHRVSLAPAGVPLEHRLTSSSETLECWVARAYFRLHVVYDARKRPIRSTLAMVNARTGKPVAFIEAQPPRLTIYAAAACRNG